METSSAEKLVEDVSYGLGFNDVDFSDRVLRLEIEPSRKRRRTQNQQEKSVTDFEVETLNVSSLMLAAKSPFFYKLFKNGMKETQKKAEFTMRINASEEAAVMDLLSFIYNKPLKATSAAELLELLIVADKYDVTSCVRHCIQMLNKFPMTVESALFYLELPSMLFVSEEVKPLLDQVKNFLASHFMDFTESQQAAAKELPLSAIEAVLGADGLQVDSEDHVFDFALRWALLHYPNLEERREIMTNRLAPLICFENMSSSKLKSIAGYPDFERERISELVINALLSKLEAQYGQYLNTTSSPIRLYNNRLLKVAQPRCAVYFHLMKEDCTDLVPLKQLCSQTFRVGGESFYLSAQRKQEKDTLGVYVHKEGGSETCMLDVELLVMNKLSEKFTTIGRFVTRMRRNKGHVLPGVFKTQWKEFVGDKSEYFIDGILHLQADITFLT